MLNKKVKMVNTLSKHLSFVDTSLKKKEFYFYQFFNTISHIKFTIFSSKKIKSFYSKSLTSPNLPFPIILYIFSVSVLKKETHFYKYVESYSVDFESTHPL